MLPVIYAYCTIIIVYVLFILPHSMTKQAKLLFLHVFCEVQYVVHWHTCQRNLYRNFFARVTDLAGWRERERERERELDMGRYLWN